MAFLKIGYRFINTEQIQYVDDWHTARAHSDVARVDVYFVGADDAPVTFYDTERDTLLAWLDKHSESATAGEDDTSDYDRVVKQRVFKVGDRVKVTRHAIPQPDAYGTVKDVQTIQDTNEVWWNRYEVHFDNGRFGFYASVQLEPVTVVTEPSPQTEAFNVGDTVKVVFGDYAGLIGKIIFTDENDAKPVHFVRLGSGVRDWYIEDQLNHVKEAQS